MTDEWLMSDWWVTDEWLMSDWWATDEQLMSDWWTTDEQLMSDYRDFWLWNQTHPPTDGQHGLLSHYRDWKLTFIEPGSHPLTSKLNILNFSKSRENFLQMFPVDIPGQSSNVDLGGGRSLTPGPPSCPSPHLVTSLLLISHLLLHILWFTFLELGGRRARTFLSWPGTRVLVNAKFSS